MNLIMNNLFGFGKFRKYRIQDPQNLANSANLDDFLIFSENIGFNIHEIPTKFHPTWSIEMVTFAERFFV